MSYLTVVFGVLVLIFVIYVKFLKTHVNLIQHLRKLPGPPESLLGNVFVFLDSAENIFKTVRRFAREYYPIYCLWGGPFGAANLLDPRDFEMFLSSTKHITKSDLYDPVRSWLSEGLLTSTGSKWQKRRKILTPAFHFNILQEYIKVFHKETQTLVKKIKKEVHKPYVDVTEMITDFALETIAETAMGTSFTNENVSKVEEYKQAIYEIGEIFVQVLVRPWYKFKFIYFFTKMYREEKKLLSVLHNFTKEVITQRETNFTPLRIEVRESYAKRKHLAMLDLLLTAKIDNTIDDDGVREEVDTFMFEGHDTTSMAITYALMLLACHPQIQEQIVEEMRSVLTNTHPDYKTLHDLQYMERCIKEVLRLYPSVPIIGRVLDDDVTTATGYLLKRGTMIHFHIYDLHRNPEIYPEPEKFDPDRFLPENSQNRHPFAYVPFSAGPRNCIGQKFAMLEIKAVLCGILSEFVLEPVDTPETVTFVTDLVLRSKNHVRVKFIPRGCK